MEEKKEDIKFKSMSLRLAKVDYSRIKKIHSNAKVVVNDTIISKETSKDGFLLLYTREVSLKPSSNFTIEVAFELEGVFSDESSAAFAGDLSKIEKFIEKRKKEILESWRAPALASTIISNLTIIDDVNPLISIPHILEKDRE